MNDGPFTQAINSDKTDVIKEEYIVYRKKGDCIIKESYARTHYRNDYHDTSTVEPLVKI